MPNPDILDAEYIMINRYKVQKIFHEQTQGKKKIVTFKRKMHLYSQCAGVKGPKSAIMFHQGIEKNGLVKYVENLGQKYFKMVDLNNVENISEKTLNAV